MCYKNCAMGTFSVATLGTAAKSYGTQKVYRRQYRHKCISNCIQVFVFFTYGLLYKKIFCPRLTSKHCTIKKTTVQSFRASLAALLAHWDPTLVPACGLLCSPESWTLWQQLPLEEQLSVTRRGRRVYCPRAYVGSHTCTDSVIFFFLHACF